MAPQIASGNDLIHNDLSEESGQSSFACSHCRKQKVKCDRLLPSCANCNKSSRPCSYPLTVQKPGPKAGTTRRPRLQSSPNATDHSRALTENGAKRRKTDDGTSPSSLPKSATGPASYHPGHQTGQAEPEKRHSSKTVSTASVSPRVTTKQDNPLLRIVHPDHDPADNNITLDHRSHNDSGAFLRRFDMACARLGCSSDQGWDLIHSYFKYMTSHSLFHRPTFEQKLSSMTSPQELQAFLSALFSYALRFKPNIASVKDTSISAKAMLDASCRLQHECMEACLDDQPPLHLLQSLYLVTFQKLIHGVRGKTWRMLGDCIRLGYELRLHLIDAQAIESVSDVDHTAQVENWLVSEERRRIWWALWEMDVFSSTIRRLPSAIDERLNYTFLPVHDENWFSGCETRSCFLAADAMQRWRDIAESGNRSPQTWFILVNSYMFDAHKLGAFPEVWAKRIGFDMAAQRSDDTGEKLVPRMRDFLDNCLRCAQKSLPRELNWDEKFLSFNASIRLDGPSAQALDSARYCIHVMCQLARLMLCMWEVHHTTLSTMHSSTEQKPRLEAEAADARGAQHRQDEVKNEHLFWHRYVDAANLTAEVVRNSSPQHYQFVNPLIANALWYAAATLVVAKLFGPPGLDCRLAQSNFDLLVATLNKFELFWQIPSVLKYKLRNLEETLNALKQKPTSPSQLQDLSAVLALGASRNGKSEEVDILPQYEQQLSQHASDNLYTGFFGEDWAQQDLFDFSNIPTFGFGQSDLFQAMPIDANFENNTLMQNDGINFNDLFMYPYQ